MSAPVVSIVLPVRNGADTVAATIRSVIAQHRQEWELVVVDDGSTDHTLDVVQSLAADDPRIVVLRGPASGVSAARNTGIAASTADLVTFIDADDTVEEHWLDALVEPLRNDADIAISFCSSATPAGLSPARRWTPSVHGGLLGNRPTLFLAGTYAVRRDLVTEAGGFDERPSFGENHESGVRLVATSNARGMRFAATEVVHHRRAYDPERAASRDAQRLEHAERLLDEHGDILQTMPAEQAKSHRISAVNASRIGRHAVARQHGRRAVRVAPRSVQSWTIALRAHAPFAAARWHRNPAVTTSGSQPSGLPRRVQAASRRLRCQLEQWAYIARLAWATRLRSPIVVFTFGKVGSTSLTETLRTHSSRPVLHVHAISRSAVHAATRNYVVHGRGGTPFNAWRGTYVRLRWKFTRKRRVVTVVRDPVARNISAFFQVADAYGLEGVSDATADAVDVARLARTFFDEFDEHAGPLHWYAEEFAATTGVDVFAHPPPTTDGWTVIRTPDCDVALLRTEDLDRTGPAALSAFLGTPVRRLADANRSTHKEYGEAYRRLVATIRFPAEYLRAAYTSQLATHMYTPDELDAFTTAWSDR